MRASGLIAVHPECGSLEKIHQEPPAAHRPTLLMNPAPLAAPVALMTWTPCGGLILASPRPAIERLMDLTNLIGNTAVQTCCVIGAKLDGLVLGPKAETVG